MKRDWKEFFRYSRKAWKGSLIGMAFIPPFYFLMNPHFDGDSLLGLMYSLRIGLEVMIANVIFFTTFYAILYKHNMSLLLRFKQSVRMSFAVGLFSITLGLLFASFVEPLLGGPEMHLRGIIIGVALGGGTYLVFVFRSAYREVQNHNLRLRATSAESNLNVLKNQLQPHFLFNSLNSLAELIDVNHDVASQMTQKLSDLYREILESSKAPTSSLASEISIVKKYLELEALRFGSRLKYELEVPDEMESIHIPSLLLQTLVENAVKHGISQSLDGGIVKLKIEKLRDGFLVYIENPSPKKSLAVASTGTGLANTVSRLDLLYGPRHGFNMNTTDGKTQVHFWFSGAMSV